MPLSRREQRFVAAGALVAVLGLGYLLWPASTPTASSVELVPAAERPAAPPPAPPAPPSAVVAPAAPVASGVPEGVRLTGVMGRGATFAFPDNSQRYVPVGGSLAPGLTLQAVRVDGVLLASGVSSWRLGFGGAAVAVGAAPGTPVPAAAAPGANAETQMYQQAMAPVRTGNRVTGFTVRPGFNLPALQRAGIQPGDTIVGINGAEFSPEALQELAWTIANNPRTEFEVERGGRRMRFAAQGGR